MLPGLAINGTESRVWFTAGYYNGITAVEELVV
jgi:hypothetical protein